MSRKIEEFKPINPPKVGYYSCGPTVYDYQHIGNFRTYVGADILQRVLEYNGYDVQRVMNITDVGHLTSQADTGDDKMEKSASQKGKTVWEIADFYTKDFFEALAKLNVETPKIICKATDYIPEMISLIKQLEHGGYTYRIEDGVYFDTSKLSDYGKLAKTDIKGLKAGMRVEMVPGKKNPTDFALWKFSPSTSSGSPKRQMEWDSPWGKGFPGWHIECSAMSMKNLGETIDIHSGGIDHISIHHTNEKAQSESATGKPFVNYWVHFAFLLVDGVKMSKSLGNFYTQHDIEKHGFDLLDLRYTYLNTHYRSIMNFTWESISAGHQALERLRGKVAQWKVDKQNKLGNEKLRNEYKTKFIDAINEDLNMPTGLSVVWQISVDQKVKAIDKLSLIEKFDKVLGLKLIENSEQKTLRLRSGQADNIPGEVLELAKEREKARSEKNWQKSDKLRLEIENKGYELEDTKNGFKLNPLTR